MKHKTKVKPPIKTAERERLENLINLAIEKYRLEDIVSAFIEATDNWRDRGTVVKCMMESEDYKHDFNFELEDDYKKGKIFIQVETQAEEMKIMELISGSGIIAPYNQTQLFA